MEQDQQQPQQRIFTEWCPELERALAEPFPRELHKNIGTKGTHVPVHHYVARLNSLVGVHGWSMPQPAAFHAGNKLTLTIGVTILGVTKWNVGDEMEDHGEPIEYVDDNGQTREKVVDFGTAGTNAFAQGFKRCLAYGFRMGLYLYNKNWTKKYLAGVSGQQQNGSTPPQQQNQQRNNAPRQGGDAPVCPNCGGAMWDNRAKKAQGKFAAESPDFRCKNNRVCDGAITLQEA